MKLIVAFFRLIRWPNLFIIGLTQWMVWEFVITPMQKWSDNALFLNGIHFLILCLSTILIAAAGYIINDYFDVRIDLINNPQKVIIDNVFSRRTAIALHSVLNILGLLLVFYLAWKLEMILLPIIQLACTVLLWFYSTKFKREYIIGNFVVALLVSFAILILPVYEPSFYSFAHFDLIILVQDKKIINPLGIIIVYALFAFILTWMREIVKDMEDFKGDIEDGCVTMPIKIGIQKSVRFVLLLGCFSILPLIFISIKLLQMNSWLYFGIYILFALVFPIVFLMISLPRKKTQTHYNHQSLILKLIMIPGIVSLPVYWLLQY